MYHHDVIPIECVEQFDDGVGLILVTRNSPEEVGKFLLIAQPFRSRQIRHLRNLPNAKYKTLFLLVFFLNHYKVKIFLPRVRLELTAFRL